MLENIPSHAAMTELLGQSLYEVWQALCSAIDKKYDMVRIGLTSTNTAEAEKPFAACTQKAVVLDS